ncbi:kinase-like domain-containing protein [Phlyctochytrium arcticum]|nr:kinase-like domain-containing protein [Phlyctochytrium arcticum]
MTRTSTGRVVFTPEMFAPKPDQDQVAIAAAEKVAQKKAVQLSENQAAAIEFLESTLEKKLPTADLHTSLRNGVLLCELINKLRPGSIRVVSTRDAPFLQMENITRFLDACKTLGLQGHELFQTVDLYENKDMQQVIITILTIARIVAGSPYKSRLPTELNPYRSGVIIHDGKSADIYSDEKSDDISKLDEPIFTASDRPPPPVHSKSVSASFIPPARPALPAKLKKADSDKGFRTARGRNESPARTSRPNSRASSARGSRVPLERIVIGPYQLGASIGKGQFGTVYQALNTETGQVVGIKRIPLADHKEAGVRELMQEVELLESLTHANIVKYLGFMIQDEHLNIILEFMECGSLQSVMKKYGLLIPEKLAAVYVEDILKGLTYLHDKGVVHCDLKCANILTAKDSTVKLSDFGVSKQLSGVGEDEQAVAGTPYWMAPEIIELKGASTASDIWSLGCTVIEMITGKPPYLDLKNPMTALFRIVEDDSPPLPEDISEELRDFFSKCFQRDITKRWSARELLKHDWIRLKYKDPKTAEESAKLLEVGTKIIQENAISSSSTAASLTSAMESIPEPAFDNDSDTTNTTPSTSLPTRVPSPLTTTLTSTATDYSATFSSPDRSSVSAEAEGSRSYRSSHNDDDSSDPSDSLHPPSPSNSQPGLARRRSEAEAVSQQGIRPSRSAPEVNNDSEQFSDSRRIGASVGRLEQQEMQKRKKSIKKAKRKSMTGQLKDKDKDCLVM